MQRIARRGLSVAAVFHSMDAIILNTACRDLRQDHVSEKWIQVVFDPKPMSLDINRVPLTLGDDLELVHEPCGSFLEKLPGLELTGSAFALQFEIPILREILRAAEAVVLRGDAPVASV